jgi:hypothetical protein
MDDARGAAPDERSADASPSLRYEQALQGVSAIVAPVTLLTAIAFYFGWARVQAFDAYFGLNAGTVGYSTRDYVLNSLNALFVPVVVVLVALLALALAHAYVGHVHRTGRRSAATLRQFSEVLLICGALLLLVGGFGVFGVFPFHTPYLISTLFPAAGVLLIAHAVNLRARLRGDPPLATAGRVLVGLFVAVCLFWATGLYARTVGRDEAAKVARHLDELPGVTIASAASLDLPTGGGTPIPVSAGAKSYTYRRLRLLALSNGTMFLLPDGWTAAHGKLFAVPQAAATRLAFTPGKVPSSSSLVASGFTGNNVPSVSGSGPGATGQSRKLGPLLIRLEQPESEAAVVTLVNKTSRAISGVSVAARLGKRAQPLVFGGAAECRVARVRFACKLDAIPAHGRRALRISYRGPHTVHVRLAVRLGALRRVLQLQLSR